jgi:hypothetical protein
MDDVAIRDFTRQMAERNGVTDDQVVIVNIFELEQPSTTRKVCDHRLADPPCATCGLGMKGGS